MFAYIQGWHHRVVGQGGQLPPIIFKKQKKRKKGEKGEKSRKNEEKNNKPNKMNQNDLFNAVYKWVKTDEFFRG